MTGPFDHLRTLTDSIGLFEHADHAAPRPEHGYCTDDVARLVVAVAREPHEGPRTRDLVEVPYRFLAAAQDPHGRVTNRRSIDGAWHGAPDVEDCWGRAMWAFGTAAASPWFPFAHDALARFTVGAGRRSPHRRAMAFAGLGAAEVVNTFPGHAPARALLADAARAARGAVDDERWPWPEPRLSYANAALADVTIAAGHLLDRPDVLDDGLRLLRWLVARETFDGHLSPTPVGGAGPLDRAPAFDQQPIEVSTLADACVRAFDATDDHDWLRALRLAVRWFEGDNDRGAVMQDPTTGGGYDGLCSGGANLNQGAESTLALATTLQHGARLVAVASGQPTSRSSSA